MNVRPLGYTTLKPYFLFPLSYLSITQQIFNIESLTKM